MVSYASICDGVIFILVCTFPLNGGGVFLLNCIAGTYQISWSYVNFEFGGNVCGVYLYRYWKSPWKSVFWSRGIQDCLTFQDYGFQSVSQSVTPPELYSINYIICYTYGFTSVLTLLCEFIVVPLIRFFRFYCLSHTPINTLGPHFDNSSYDKSWSQKWGGCGGERSAPGERRKQRETHCGNRGAQHGKGNIP